jgi:hypothetical protein
MRHSHLPLILRDLIVAPPLCRIHSHLSWDASTSWQVAQIARTGWAINQLDKRDSRLLLSLLAPRQPEHYEDY